MTSPKTCTSPPATAAPPWTATPSRSRPGQACAAPKAGSLSVLARGRAKITGQLERAGKHMILQPDDPRITGPVAPAAATSPRPDRPGGGGRDHALPRRGPTGPRGRGAQGAGRSRRSAHRGREDPRLRRHPDEFPDEVARIADGAARRRCAPRTSSTASICATSPFLTIDPETARDFDDAVVRRGAARRRHAPVGRGRRRLALRARGHAARREARIRGCCVYLPDRAIPMLPEPLSARICSLVPEVDRLAMVVRIDLDQRRAAWCDTRLLRGGDPLARAPRLPGRRGGAGRRHARHAREVRAVPAGAAARWTRWRAQMRGAARARGALDFDLPEAEVVLDEDDPRLRARRPQVAPRPRRAAGLLAGRGVHARRQRGGRAPSSASAATDTVWRVHARPIADAAGGVRRRWPSATASQSTPRRRARRRGCKRVLEQAQGPPGREARCRSCCCAR